MAVEVRFTKWGGKSHWHFPAEALGQDEHGWWLGTRAGVPIQRGNEPPITYAWDFVTLIPAAGWWVAYWNGDLNRQTAVYVDVSTAPVIGPDRVEAVDLDLDVIRERDGSVHLVDEDEFAEHQVRYGYPADVIAQAVAAADELVAMVTGRQGPFGDAGENWLAGYSAR